MFTISKDFHFSASHALTAPEMPPDHPCRRLHGHNYVVRVTLSFDDLDARGFVFDFNDLAAFGRLVDEFDHRHLNDMLVNPPTAENLAYELFHLALQRDLIPDRLLESISVSETPKTWATYDRR